MQKVAVISLSGGLDSTCLMIKLLSDGYEVHGLSFNYGQKHVIELQRLSSNLEYLKSKGYELSSYNVVDLSNAFKAFNSSLVDPNIIVPEGHYEEENMKSTFVPNRNSIFSSVIYGYALSIATKKSQKVEVFLGVHSGDHEIYPDCRPQFYEALEFAFKIGNWNSDLVDFNLPYMRANKTSILQYCVYDCDHLGIDFDTILGNTMTSYNPDSNGLSSGKSGSDIERIEAFINIGRVDPVGYVNGWEKAKEHALTILKK